MMCLISSDVPSRRENQPHGILTLKIIPSLCMERVLEINPYISFSLSWCLSPIVWCLLVGIRSFARHTIQEEETGKYFEEIMSLGAASSPQTRRRRWWYNTRSYPHDKSTRVWRIDTCTRRCFTFFDAELRPVILQLDCPESPAPVMRNFFHRRTWEHLLFGGCFWASAHRWKAGKNQTDFQKPFVDCICTI